MKISSYEKIKYILKEKEDLVILEKIKQLEKLKTDNKDKQIIRLIRTQLEHNWRLPLIKHLNKLLKKYQK